MLMKGSKAPGLSRPEQGPAGLSDCESAKVILVQEAALHQRRYGVQREPVFHGLRGTDSEKDALDRGLREAGNFGMAGLHLASSCAGGVMASTFRPNGSMLLRQALRPECVCRVSRGSKAYTCCRIGLGAGGIESLPDCLDSAGSDHAQEIRVGKYCEFEVPIMPIV